MAALGDIELLAFATAPLDLDPVVIAAGLRLDRELFVDPGSTSPRKSLPPPAADLKLRDPRGFKLLRKHRTPLVFAVKGDLCRKNRGFSVFHRRDADCSAQG